MVVIGIDPGTATVGFGIVKKTRKNVKCLNYGIIKTDPDSLPEKRLEKIQKDLLKLIKKYNPSLLVVENLYFFKNLKTAIPVSEAKGVILLTAAKKNIPVLQITPLEVKLAICGYGRASKIQVQKMIQNILKLKELPRPDDAADALGLSLCGLNLMEFNKKKKFSAFSNFKFY